MKAPSKCPVCGEKRKWKLVDKGKHGNMTGAVAGGAIGAFGGPLGMAAGALIGNAVGKGKKSESYVCGACGFAHTYIS